MIDLMIKSAILSISLLFAGFSFECPTNIKLDENLCNKFIALNGDSFVKFRIVLQQPVIEQTDQRESKSGEEFSKYYQDSLARYLKANLETIQSIVTDNVLYTVTSSQDNPVRLTADNLNVDFTISAYANKETILNLAEKYSIISRIEYYEEYGPSPVTRKTSIQGKEMCSFLFLNGKKIKLQTSSGAAFSSITVYDLHGRTVRSFTTNGQSGNVFLTANLPMSSYILSVKNNLGQSDVSLIDIQ